MTKRETMIAYLKLKVEEQDWHGVADAAMDLREIDAEDKGRREATAPIVGHWHPVDCDCCYEAR